MTPADRPPWRAGAFGLDISGHFPVPGLSGAGAPAVSGARTRLVRASREEIGEAVQELVALPFSVGRDEAGAFVVDHPLFGAHRVLADGSEIACAAPSALPDWLWQRLLIGQLLPLAALLCGYEPLHASAVEVDGRAILMMGASGAGKSSVALHLSARGAGLMADDVSALAMHGDTVVAHSGPAIASVDAQELSRLSEPAAGWSRLGSHDGEVRVALDGGPARALPVGAVYVLARRADAEVLGIRAPRLSSAKLLLGGTFNAYLRDPARLARQLEITGRLAETVPLREVGIPPAAGAAEVAAAIAAEC